MHSYLNLRAIWDSIGIFGILGFNLLLFQNRLGSLMYSIYTRKWNPEQRRSEEDHQQNAIHCIVFVIDGSVLTVLPSRLVESMTKIKIFANTLGKRCSFCHFAIIFQSYMDMFVSSRI